MKEHSKFFLIGTTGFWFLKEFKFPVFKNLLLFSILGILGFFAWKHFTTKPSPPTPEQQVSAFVSQSVLPATELASLCEKYPQLVTKALKGEKVVVSGVLAKGMVLGVNSNDLKLELVGVPKLKISFQSDFGRKERWGAPAGFRFQKRGNEIVAISVAKPTKPGHSDKNEPEQVYSQIDTSNESAALQSIVGAIAKAYGSSTSVGGIKKSATESPSEKVERALCREGDTLTLRGEFRNIAPGWVKCDLLELP
ncbi:MAG: hypothetical protein ACO3FQ_03835 [Terrimicrobiaceae bacterium]